MTRAKFLVHLDRVQLLIKENSHRFWLPEPKSCHRAPARIYPARFICGLRLEWQRGVRAHAEYVTSVAYVPFTTGSRNASNVY